MFRPSAFIVSAAAILAGCSFSNEISRHAVEYNHAVERAENEMLLLNVLRAAEGRPMHFTRISEISGSLKGSIQGTVTTTEGPSNDLLSFVGGSETNPTFGLQIFNDKEFFTGFNKPIEADVFANFVGQGYRMDDLSKMLIEGANIAFTGAKDGEKLTTTCFVYRNFDGLSEWDEKVLDSYLEFVRILKKHRRTPDTKKPAGEKGVLEVKIEDGRSLKAIKDLQNAGFDINFTGGNGIAIKKPSSSSAAGPIASVKGLRGGALSEDIAEVKETRSLCGEPQFKLLDSWLEAASVAASQSKKTFTIVGPNGRTYSDVTVDVEMSSAEGMFFALGEMLNYSRQRPIRAAKLGYFSVIETPEPTPGAIVAEFDGKRFSVADDEKSVFLFSLARQVFSLNTSAPRDKAFQRTRVILQ